MTSCIAYTLYQKSASKAQAGTRQSGKHALEIIHTHRPIASVPSHAFQTAICGVLAGVEVFAVAFAVVDRMLEMCIGRRGLGWMCGERTLRIVRSLYPMLSRVLVRSLLMIGDLRRTLWEIQLMGKMLERLPRDGV